jgi:hypothetical protein
LTRTRTELSIRVSSAACAARIRAHTRAERIAPLATHAYPSARRGAGAPSQGGVRGGAADQCRAHATHQWPGAAVDAAAERAQAVRARK